MWYDADERLRKAVERFEEGDLEAARAMLRGLDRRGVISPRIDLYLGHCHLEADRPEAALARYRRAAALSPEAAAPWIGLGLVHGRLGQIERAVGAFERALELEPEAEEAHCNLTHCHALSGNLERARAHAAEARRLDPGCPHTLRHLAVGALLAERARESLDLWAQVEALEPAHPELDLGRARAWARLNRLPEARQAYLRALGGVFRADAAWGLGELDRRSERWQEALAHFTTALATEPDHLEAQLAQIDVLTRLGRASEAWERLLPLIEAQPRDAEVVGAAGPVLSALGRARDALGLLRAMVAAQPDDPRAWLCLGRHLVAVGRPGRAIRPLRRAWRVAPDESEAPQLLARALARRGRRKEAVRVLSQALGRQPRAQDLALDLAAAHWARGRPEAADRALVRSLAFHPEAAAVWAAAAEVALEAGRLGTARSRLRSALRWDRGQPQALALLVRWLLRMDRPRQALQAARVALRVAAPGEGVARDLAEAHLRLGQPEQARLVLRRYVLERPGDPQGYRLLARSFEATGDLEAARAQARLAAAVASLEAGRGSDARRRTLRNT